MSEKKTKEQLRGEIESIFDQLIANSPSQPTDEVSANSPNKPDDGGGKVLNETQAQNLVLEGRSEIIKGHFASALKLFNQALELDPRCEDAWSAMGDALMKMGKIDQASICYKKAMTSTFKLDEAPFDDGESGSDTRENDWQGYLMSFLETTKNDPEQKNTTVEVRQPKSEQDQPDSEGPIESIQNVIKGMENMKSQTSKEDIHFPCPTCGSDVELDSGVCSQCQTTFKEERFENFESMDDDLVFFSRIKALLGKEERFFIHFNGEDGSIRFLDKRETSKAKKPFYVFVSANIERLGYDYSVAVPKRAELKDIEADIEEE